MIEESLTNKTDIVVVGETDKYLKFSDFLKKKPDETEFKPVKVDSDSTGIIFFSSGTTGLPKGISLSHYGLILGTASFMEGSNVNSAVGLHFTSLYWISAAVMLIMSHLDGGCRIACSKVDGEICFDLIEKYKVTFTFISPTIGNLLVNVKNPERFDTSSLYSLIAGGSVMTAHQKESVRKLFPNTFFTTCYGMTESYCYLTVFNAEKDKNIYRNKSGASGRPIPGVIFKVVDPETEETLEPTKQGELRNLTPVRMNGYYNADSSDSFDNEGYIKSGDIGYFDEDGYIYIVDRIKEMFKYRSWHVIPASVEAIILEHPSVQEVVVFGVPHDEDGERPAASVVLTEDGKNVSAEDIVKFVDERCNDFQKLRGGVAIVDSLAKTPTGKYMRRKAREMFLTIGKLK